MTLKMSMLYTFFSLLETNEMAAAFLVLEKKPTTLPSAAPCGVEAHKHRSLLSKYLKNKSIIQHSH